MGPITYSIIIALVFLAGIIAFRFFETPRVVLNKGVRKLREIKFIAKPKQKSSLIVPAQPEPRDTNNDLRIYVHEY
jgi:hypothetical protein